MKNREQNTTSISISFILVTLLAFSVYKWNEVSITLITFKENLQKERKEFQSLDRDKDKDIIAIQTTSREMIKTIDKILGELVQRPVADISNQQVTKKLQKLYDEIDSLRDSLDIYGSKFSEEEMKEITQKMKVSTIKIIGLVDTIKNENINQLKNQLKNSVRKLDRLNEEKTELIAYYENRIQQEKINYGNQISNLKNKIKDIKNKLGNPTEEQLLKNPIVRELIEKVKEVSAQQAERIAQIEIDALTKKNDDNQSIISNLEQELSLALLENDDARVDSVSFLLNRERHYIKELSVYYLDDNNIPVYLLSEKSVRKFFKKQKDLHIDFKLTPYNFNKRSSIIIELFLKKRGSSPYDTKKSFKLTQETKFVLGHELFTDSEGRSDIFYLELIDDKNNNLLQTPYEIKLFASI